jgi:hypothetical protein
MRRQSIATKLQLELLEARHLLAANILVVFNPSAPATQPDDNALRAALIAGGNTIDADSGSFATALPTPAQLADVDVIVVSRATNSVQYNDQGGEAAAWNALGKPMIVMNPFLARSSHWGLLNGTNLPADLAAPTNYNAFPNAANPFVAGLTTSFAPAGLQIDTLNSTTVPSGATTVATITVNGVISAAIVDIPAAAPSFITGNPAFGARRVYFTLPDYPDKANQDYDDVVTANSNSILLRIVDGLVVIVNPPSAPPTDLSASVASSTQVNLFWSDNANNETEYQVERKLASGGSYATIATLPANATNYANTGLTANTQYLYRVRAANSAGNSAYSNEVNATTLPLGSQVPSVTAINPGPGSTGVFLDKDIVANVSVPNGGINSATLSPSTVRIYPTGNPGAAVAAVLNTSGGGDIIVARLVSNLAANTSYTFEVTSGLQDDSGVGFTPFTSTFTTGTQTSPVDNSIQFQHVALANVPIGQYPAVTIGPDHKLYAAGVDGFIYRWNILADGTLGPIETLPAFHNAQGDRLLIGLTFDPASTPTNLIAWLTSSQFTVEDAIDFTGKLTRVSGANLETVQDVLINLPRSEKDHVTNQSAFGPDGALYFLQGSMSAMGAPDNAWGNRTEHLLNAAVLRFDPTLWNAAINGPLDVHTEDAVPYNPFAPGAPLTLYATGIRNAYSLVWASNGYLYVPTNGSASGGNTPGTPAIPGGGLLPRTDSAANGPYFGPAVPALVGVGTQHDWLFKVVQGGYYGHPNPLRNEYVLNGGDPTSGSDPAQVIEYPDGTLPDRNYRGFAYDFGLNFSPDGVIEYQYGGFGGALVGKLLVVRFSAGDDIIVLEPGLNGDITSANANIASFDGFNDPLDLIEDPVNGNLYVSQFDRAGFQGTITLLRPQEAKITTNVNQLIFDEVRGGAASAAKTLTVFNTGTGALTLSNISLTGTDAALFTITPAVTAPQTIPVGASLNINIVFNPVTGTLLGTYKANLHLATNDADHPTIDFYLGGLATPGEEGNNEPSWQWVMDTFRIPINVGDSNPATGPIEGIVLPNANNIPRFVKAGPGAVTIEMLAAFVGDSFAEPAGIIGWYDSPAALHELFRLGSGDSGQHQEMNPTIASGATSFDPGAADFGLYSNSPTFPTRIVYSENALNTWDSGIQKHEVFPLKDISGAVVPNAYVVGVEEASNNDFQDYVYIIRNVAATTGDFNEDGRADGTDFLAWQRGLGTSPGATRAGGDANFDGTVAAADLGIWKQQFGQLTSSVVVSTASEVAAVMAPPLSESADSGGTFTSVSSRGLGTSPATDLTDLAFGGGAGRGHSPVLPRLTFRPTFADNRAEWRPATPVTRSHDLHNGGTDADPTSVGAEHDHAFESLGANDEELSGLRFKSLL